MNKRLTAGILAASALMLAAGAGILFMNSTPDAPEVRQAVEPPPEKPEAPAWVNTGQDANPDYSSAETEAQNATPVPEETVVQVVEVTEDSVVTFTFVNLLADFFLDRFIPVDENGTPSTSVNAKTLNVHFGRDLDGFMVSGDDIRMARKNVLEYAFTPKMIDSLSDLYTPVLMEQIVDSALNDSRDYTIGVEKEHRTLTNQEVKSMLLLNAAQMDKTASLMKGMADNPEITNLAGQYLQAAEAVDRANSQLQMAIADEKDTSLAGKRLKQAIMQREAVKKSIIDLTDKACADCSMTEAFYLAQWGYRRVLGQTDTKLKTFDSAASAISGLASEFRKKAETISQ